MDTVGIYADKGTVFVNRGKPSATVFFLRRKNAALGSNAFCRTWSSANVYSHVHFCESYVTLLRIQKVLLNIRLGYPLLLGPFICLRSRRRHTHSTAYRFFVRLLICNFVLIVFTTRGHWIFAHGRHEVHAMMWSCGDFWKSATAQFIRRESAFVCVNVATHFRRCLSDHVSNSTCASLLSFIARHVTTGVTSNSRPEVRQGTAP